MNTLVRSRNIKATPEMIFKAMTTPERLSRWWGPKGFSNTFKICDMKLGGQWVFIMHGPDGKDYDNECEFGEIITNEKFVVHHIVEPKFTATFSLLKIDDGTLLEWTTEFENGKFLESMRDFLTTANDQNLDRLEAEVFGHLES